MSTGQNAPSSSIAIYCAEIKNALLELEHQGADEDPLHNLRQTYSACEKENLRDALFYLMQSIGDLVSSEGLKSEHGERLLDLLDRMLQDHRDSGLRLPWHRCDL